MNFLKKVRETIDFYAKVSYIKNMDEKTDSVTDFEKIDEFFKQVGFTDEDLEFEFEMLVNLIPNNERK